MFVVSLNYKVPLTEIDRLAPAHVEWLKACYAEGVFVASGPKKPRTGGIIIARGPRDVLDARLAAVVGGAVAEDEQGATVDDRHGELTHAGADALGGSGDPER